MWVKTISAGFYPEEKKACCFQCPDDLGKFNFLFCSHSGNLAYVIVQKEKKLVKLYILYF